MRSLALAFALICVPLAVSAFYLPGVAPQDYPEGAVVELKVNKLTSVKTQLPYDYYRLPYCEPVNRRYAAENLGEILMGDLIENSDYELRMNIESSCQILCKKGYNRGELQKFKDMIDDDYRVNWLVDNLPAATRVHDPENPNRYMTNYEKGFPVGFKKKGAYFVNNHARMTVKIHKSPDNDGFRVVGFEVEVFSVQHHLTNNKWDGKDSRLDTCTPTRPVSSALLPQKLDVEGDNQMDIVWTYDVVWEMSEQRWASRWDHYLLMHDDQIHWFSIINSLMIVFFLTGMVGMIMLRTLRRDIRRYNELANSEDQQEETGWKLVHADVFRNPNHPMLLSVYVGTGVQVLSMLFITLIFAVLGFLSPANRGGLLTAMILLYVFMGIFAGYTSARLYKMFKGDQWKRATILTAFMFPGVAFGIFFILNLFIWGEKSSGAVPFGTMFALLVLWFGISVPLVFLGSYFGYKKEEVKHPVRTNQIPRQIPPQTWYMQPMFSVLIGGILPFGAIFIELFFIMSSIWLHQFYYVFGFLFIVMIILVLTCAEISIVMVYFQLCSEDYHWWWRSYLTSGSSALYLFCYSILYFSTKLDMKKFVSGLLFFGYMFLISYGFFIVTGTIGFCASFVFVRQIYASVKVD